MKKLPSNKQDQTFIHGIVSLGVSFSDLFSWTTIWMHPYPNLDHWSSIIALLSIFMSLKFTVYFVFNVSEKKGFHMPWKNVKDQT